ncbi:MAG: UdgX family uracil-DNA binding protein [Vulcanimicrobiaceae bacterium]
MPAAKLQTSAADFLPKSHSLKALREAAAHCRGCELYKNATQTVFGEGKAHAAIMLVGEMPGDREDIEGHPFVGPAGKLLDRAMEAAKLPRKDVYVTNAVKHFNFIERGKRRIHATPKQIHIRACRPWLEEEIKAVRPAVVVAMGATAAQTLLGPTFRLTHHRGEVLSTDLARHVVATVHPSSILRAPDDETRHAEMEKLVEDLRNVRKVLERVARGAA